MNDARLLFDGELGRLRSAIGSKRRLELRFSADPGPIGLPYARLVSDLGALKQYILEQDDVSLVGVLSDLRDRKDLEDISLEEPGIDELIRDVYARAGAPAPHRAPAA